MVRGDLRERPHRLGAVVRGACLAGAAAGVVVQDLMRDGEDERRVDLLVDAAHAGTSAHSGYVPVRDHCTSRFPDAVGTVGAAPVK